MDLVVWGIEASPYLLKIEALLNYRGIAFRRLPRDGTRWENIRIALRLRRAHRQRRIERFPQLDPLDEYPHVPFLSADGASFQYDSTAIAGWLDQQVPSDLPPFFPSEPATAFVARLIDEAFDEYGLYMVHHQRWVCAATDTNMPSVSAAELSRLWPWPVAKLIEVNLARRQSRRCPYLFSVAPPGYRAEVEPKRIPPSREGFPPTHALLEESWHAYLAAMEKLLENQPFILGERFTVADASAYGELSMNLIDPTAVAHLQQRAPRTHRWLLDIRDGKHRGLGGDVRLTPSLRDLLEIIMQTFAPLMAQNDRAYREAVQAGTSLFNEAAFDRGVALYDGLLLGQPFRAVVKTFQVRVWRDLCRDWQQLEPQDKQSLRAIVPDWQLFEPETPSPVA